MSLNFEDYSLGGDSSFMRKTLLRISGQNSMPSVRYRHLFQSTYRRFSWATRRTEAFCFGRSSRCSTALPSELPSASLAAGISHQVGSGRVVGQPELILGREPQCVSRRLHEGG